MSKRKRIDYKYMFIILKYGNSFCVMLICCKVIRKYNIVRVQYTSTFGPQTRSRCAKIIPREEQIVQELKDGLQLQQDSWQTDSFQGSQITDGIWLLVKMSLTLLLFTISASWHEVLGSNFTSLFCWSLLRFPPANLSTPVVKVKNMTWGKTVTLHIQICVCVCPVMDRTPYLEAVLSLAQWIAPELDEAATKKTMHE